MLGDEENARRESLEWASHFVHMLSKEIGVPTTRVGITFDVPGRNKPEVLFIPADKYYHIFECLTVDVLWEESHKDDEFGEVGQIRLCVQEPINTMDLIKSWWTSIKNGDLIMVSMVPLHYSDLRLGCLTC